MTTSRRWVARDHLPDTALACWSEAEPGLQFDQTLGWSERLARWALPPGSALEVVGYDDATGRCVGLLPLVRKRRSVSALATYYTSLYEPIVAADRDRGAVLRRLFEGIEADSLDLNPLASGARTAFLLILLEELGWHGEAYFRFGNWYLQVGGQSFAEYLASRGSQLRNTIRRKGTKWQALPGASMTIAQTPAEGEMALAAFQAVRAGAWQRQEPYPDFIPSLVPWLAKRGWLRLGVARLGDRPVAAQFWIVKDGTASIFKLAYDAQYAELSVGTLLTAHLMRHALDVDKVQVVDYLSGDDAYKQDWMSRRRERLGIRAYRGRSWRGKLARMRASVLTMVR